MTGYLNNLESAGLSVASTWDLFTLFKAPAAYAFPILIMIGAVIAVLWYRGKTKKDDRAVVAEYEAPGGLTPGEIGLMHDFKLSDDRLMFAEMAWLITNAYVRIEGEGTDSTFHVTDQYDPNSFRLKDHQHRIMKALFSEAKSRSYGDVLQLGKEQFQTEILARMRTKGHIRLDPRMAKGAARDTAIGMILVGFGSIGWILGFAYTFLRVQLRTRLVGAWALYLAIYASAIQKFMNIGFLSMQYPEGTIMSHAFVFPSIPELIIALTAAIALASLPTRTPKGARMYRRIAGFKDYLETAELARTQYVEEKEGKVHDFSPYALAFKLPSKWDKTFAIKK